MKIHPHFEENHSPCAIWLLLNHRSTIVKSGDFLAFAEHRKRDEYGLFGRILSSDAVV